MFNSLYGKITAKLPQTLYLESIDGSIEWDIMVPDSSLEEFSTIGDFARVYIWLYHREDDMRLFGFASSTDRSVFVDLMKVEGIGPKGALKILSKIRPRQLAEVLDAEDLAQLETVPGIGKKTAQKMMLALKGKLTLGSDSPVAARPDSKWQDVVTALVQMGYDKRAVEEVLARLEKKLAVGASRKEQEDQLFRQAIVELAN